MGLKMKLLRVNGITKPLGSLMALNRVSLGVEEKAIHAIIGPNAPGRPLC
jgi:ABC-type branched-subunit amino acid transport system ATPase component